MTPHRERILPEQQEKTPVKGSRSDVFTERASGRGLERVEMPGPEKATIMIIIKSIKYLQSTYMCLELYMNYFM